MVLIVVLDRAPGTVQVALACCGFVVLEVEWCHMVSSDWVARMGVGERGRRVLHEDRLICYILSSCSILVLEHSCRKRHVGMLPLLLCAR